MIRKNILFAAGCGLLFLVACQSPKDQLTRKWQVETVENPIADSMMKAQIKALDTLTTVDSNMAMFFGTFNADSIKTIFKEQMESSQKQQEDAARQISMTFRNDGIMIQEGSGRSDSAKWELKGKMVLLTPARPPANTDQAVQTDTFHIEKISSSNLRFKIGPEDQALFINLKAVKGSKEAAAKVAEVDAKEKK
jgi:hypothetical protein